ncbi:MAG: PDZ domain-containing protein [Planctomycetaceae bacterium]
MHSFRNAVCVASLVTVAIAPGVVCAQTAGAETDTIRKNRQSLRGPWIGIACGEIGEDLRAHIDLPKGQGVIVREVFPGSAAAKAGIRKHDILLAVDKVRLESSHSLIQAVQKATGGELRFEVLRKGKKSTIKVLPRKRTGEHRITIQTDKALQGDARQGAAGVRKLVEQLMQEQTGLQILRNEPGQAGPNQRKVQSAAAFPNGVSVSITRNNNEPARIQVKRGDDSWEVTSDEIDSLPEDLRSGIRVMLNQDGAAAASIHLELNGVPLQLENSDQGPGRGVQIFRRDRASQSGQKVDAAVKELAEEIRRLREKVERLEKQQEK